MKIWSFYDVDGYFLDTKFYDGSDGDTAILALNTPADTTPMEIDVDRLRQRVNMTTMEVESWTSPEIAEQAEAQAQAEAQVQINELAAAKQRQVWLFMLSGATDVDLAAELQATYDEMESIAVAAGIWDA